MRLQSAGRKPLVLPMKNGLNEFLKPHYFPLSIETFSAARLLAGGSLKFAVVLAIAREAKANSLGLV